MTEQDSRFEQELESLLNKYSLDTTTNTPDFILAHFLRGCITSWRESIARRDAWWSDRQPTNYQTRG